MEGTPETALHFLQLGATFNAEGDHVRAALYFYTASRFPGVGPIVKARALLEAASHVFENEKQSAIGRSTQDVGYHRAVQWLQMASGLLKNKPNTLGYRMKVVALLDNIHTAYSEHRAAAKVIKAALDDVTVCRDAERVEVVQWWIYFRSRALCNAAAEENNVKRAVQIASAAASECANVSEHVASTAFRLASCQLALSLPVISEVNTNIILYEAQESLKTLAPRSTEEQNDIVLFRFSYFLLLTLAKIREGNLVQAKEHLIAHLKSSYGRLRNLRKGRNGAGAWEWLPLSIIPAFTIHTLAVACGNKAMENNRDPWAFHATALGKMGIRADDLANCNPQALGIRGLPSRIYIAVAAAVLDRATRYKLRALRLEPAGQLINIGIRLAFSDNAALQELSKIERQQPADPERIFPDSLRCSEVMRRTAMMLLLAEYHSLRGRISGAQIAKALLQHISMISTRFKNPFGYELVSDSWQMATSYRTLLEGQSRTGLIPSSIGQSVSPNSSSSSAAQMDVRFANKHVLAAAWVTIGVFHMRSNDVVDSRRALQIAEEILQDRTGTNLQVLASAATSLISMELTAEVIEDGTWVKMKEMLEVVESIDDPVASVRLRRQNKKLVIRMGLGEADVEEAAGAYSRAVGELYRRQERSMPVLLS